jgi:hypothetical protein
MKSTNYEAHHRAVVSVSLLFSLSGPNILLGTLFLDILIQPKLELVNKPTNQPSNLPWSRQPVCLFTSLRTNHPNKPPYLGTKQAANRMILVSIARGLHVTLPWRELINGSSK